MKEEDKVVEVVKAVEREEEEEDGVTTPTKFVEVEWSIDDEGGKLHVILRDDDSNAIELSNQVIRLLLNIQGLKNGRCDVENMYF